MIARIASRALLIAIFPLAVTLSFVLTLITEIGAAFRYAYLSAASEFETFKRIWESEG